MAGTKKKIYFKAKGMLKDKRNKKKKKKKG